MHTPTKVPSHGVRTDTHFSMPFNYETIYSRCSAYPERASFSICIKVPRGLEVLAIGGYLDSDSGQAGSEENHGFFLFVFLALIQFDHL